MKHLKHKQELTETGKNIGSSRQREKCGMAGAEEARGNSRQVLGEIAERELENLSGFEK